MICVKERSGPVTVVFCVGWRACYW